MDVLKKWLEQTTHSLTYEDLDAGAPATSPSASIAEKSVKQWTFVRYALVVIPVRETLIDLTSHRLVVRQRPLFLATLIGSLLSGVIFLFLGIGLGIEWYSLLMAVLGAVLGFVAAYRMLLVRTTIVPIRDITAVHLGPQPVPWAWWFYLVIFIVFYAFARAMGWSTAQGQSVVMMPQRSR